MRARVVPLTNDLLPLARGYAREITGVPLRGDYEIPAGGGGNKVALINILKGEHGGKYYKKI